MLTNVIGASPWSPAVSAQRWRGHPTARYGITPLFIFQGVAPGATIGEHRGAMPNHAMSRYLLGIAAWAFLGLEIVSVFTIIFDHIVHPCFVFTNGSSTVTLPPQTLSHVKGLCELRKHVWRTPTCLYDWKKYTETKSPLLSKAAHPSLGIYTDLFGCFRGCFFLCWFNDVIPPRNNYHVSQIQYLVLRMVYLSPQICWYSD